MTFASTRQEITCSSPIHFTSCFIHLLPLPRTRDERNQNKTRHNTTHQKPLRTAAISAWRNDLTLKHGGCQNEESESPSHMSTTTSEDSLSSTSSNSIQFFLLTSHCCLPLYLPPGTYCLNERRWTLLGPTIPLSSIPPFYIPFFSSPNPLVSTNGCAHNTVGSRLQGQWHSWMFLGQAWNVCAHGFLFLPG